jgi:hypothetical protein
MSGFLDRLAARSLGKARLAEPLVPVALRPQISEAEIPALPASSATRFSHPSAPEAPARALRENRIVNVEVHERFIREPEERASEAKISASFEESHVVGSASEGAERISEPAAADAPLINSTIAAPREGPVSRPPAPIPSARHLEFESSSGGVRVTIGRVEVKANFVHPAPVPPPARPKPSGLTLDDYLQQRAEGRR